MDRSDPDLEAWLNTHTRFARLVHVRSCPSTQQLAREDPEAGCAVFWADHQTAGRGREGRAWDDAAGQDLCVTFKVREVCLRNPVQLAAAVPVAIVRALTGMAELRSLETDLRIKWPNDLMLHGRKLGGILVDSYSGSGSSGDATHLVGIGVNVKRRNFPAELAEQATSLALTTGGDLHRADVLLAIARELDDALDNLAAGELSRLQTTFRDRLDLIGRTVEVETADGVLHGQLLDLDLDTLVLSGMPPLPLAHVRRLAAV